VRPRGAHSEPSAVIPIHDVKQRAFLRSRGALLRPGCSSLRRCLLFSRPPASPWGHQRQRPSRQRQFPLPDEGWMERRQPHTQLWSRLRRATPHPGATGTTLGAPPWRFSDAGPRSRLPAVEPEPYSDVPRQALWLAVGVRTSLRGGSRRVRGTPLPAPPSGSSPETPLMSEDGESYTSTPMRSQ
jgi:hypothetical protein